MSEQFQRNYYPDREVFHNLEDHGPCPKFKFFVNNINPPGSSGCLPLSDPGFNTDANDNGIGNAGTIKSGLTKGSYAKYNIDPFIPKISMTCVPYYDKLYATNGHNTDLDCDVGSAKLYPEAIPVGLHSKIDRINQPQASTYTGIGFVNRLSGEQHWHNNISDSDNDGKCGEERLCSKKQKDDTDQYITVCGNYRQDLTFPIISDSNPLSNVGTPPSGQSMSSNADLTQPPGFQMNGLFGPINELADAIASNVQNANPGIDVPEDFINYLDKWIIYSIVTDFYNELYDPGPNTNPGDTDRTLWRAGTSADYFFQPELFKSVYVKNFMAARLTDYSLGPYSGSTKLGSRYDQLYTVGDGDTPNVVQDCLILPRFINYKNVISVVLPVGIYLHTLAGKKTLDRGTLQAYLQMFLGDKIHKATIDNPINNFDDDTVSVTTNPNLGFIYLDDKSPAVYNSPVPADLSTLKSVNDSITKPNLDKLFITAKYYVCPILDFSPTLLVLLFNKKYGLGWQMPSDCESCRKYQTFGVMPRDCFSAQCPLGSKTFSDKCMSLTAKWCDSSNKQEYNFPGFQGGEDSLVYDTVLEAGSVDSVCDCWNSKIAPAVGNKGTKTAAECFTQACDGDIATSLGLTQEKCGTESSCSIVKSWIDQGTMQNPEVFNSSLYAKYCPNYSNTPRVFNWAVFIGGLFIAVGIYVVMNTHIIIDIGVTIGFILLIIFLAFDLSGVSSCRGHNSVCVSKITKRNIPGMFCSMEVGCECLNTVSSKDCPFGQSCSSGYCTKNVDYNDCPDNWTELPPKTPGNITCKPPLGNMCANAGPIDMTYMSLDDKTKKAKSCESSYTAIIPNNSTCPDNWFTVDKSECSPAESTVQGICCEAPAGWVSKSSKTCSVYANPIDNITTKYMPDSLSNSDKKTWASQCGIYWNGVQ
jgi:hypothetical protein